MYQVYLPDSFENNQVFTSVNSKGETLVTGEEDLVYEMAVDILIEKSKTATSQDEAAYADVCYYLTARHEQAIETKLRYIYSPMICINLTDICSFIKN